jgi:hypothetical protein
MNKPLKREYATKLTLIGVFISIFAFVVTRKSEQTQRDGLSNLKPLDLGLLGFATLRLGRLVAYDLVAEPLRRPFTETVPDETGAGDSVIPRGQGMQRAIGQLISCPICAGTWIAAGLTYGLQILPRPTRVFMTIMATTGIAESLNSIVEAFCWFGQVGRTLSGSISKEASKTDKGHEVLPGRQSGLEGFPKLPFKR